MNECTETVAIDITPEPQTPPKRSLQAIIEDLSEADRRLAKYTAERAAAMAELVGNLPSKRTAVIVTTYGPEYRKVVYLVSADPNGQPLIESADIADD